MRISMGASNLPPLAIGRESAMRGTDKDARCAVVLL